MVVPGRSASGAYIKPLLSTPMDITDYSLLTAINGVVGRGLPKPKALYVRPQDFDVAVEVAKRVGMGLSVMVDDSLGEMDWYFDNHRVFEQNHGVDS